MNETETHEVDELTQEQKKQTDVWMTVMFSTLGGLGIGQVFGSIYGARYPDAYNQYIGWFPIWDVLGVGSASGALFTLVTSVIFGLLFLLLAVGMANGVLEQLLGAGQSGGGDE
jgi:hypothetical protein